MSFQYHLHKCAQLEASPEVESSLQVVKFESSAKMPNLIIFRVITETSCFCWILWSLVDEEKINCSFEENFCLWRQDFDDDGDWLRAQGANLPPNTGPSFDHTTGDQSGAIKHSHNYRPNCRLLLLLWKSVPAPNRVVKFGTQIEDSLNINHSKFGVSNSNPLAPPTAYICTHVYANNLAEGSIAPYDIILNFSKKLIFELLLPYCSNFFYKN